MSAQPESLAQQQAPKDALGRVTIGTGATLLAVAAAHQAAQNALSGSVLRAVLNIWFGIPFGNLSAGWVTAGPRIYGYLSAAQEIAASQSAAYVQHALRVQGITIDMPPLVPRQFAGIASDGRNLENLLVGAIVHAKERTARGDSPDKARASGTAFLATVVKTEIIDAGTMADQVAIIVAQRDPAATTRPTASGTIKTDEGRKVRYGWVRMLNPPSCGRCAMLAGRFYKWNDGFERHPNCDCKHIPVEESIAGDITTDPYAYFRSLSIADQEKYFGVANSAAISAGADINQVMNAALRRGGLYVVGKRRFTREGTTRAGYYTQLSEAGRMKSRRPTPWQIMQDARGDQSAAIRLLKQFGYIVS
jgi:hypothetical protein